MISPARFARWALLLLGGLTWLAPQSTAAAPAGPIRAGDSRPPNIVFILADDLGYGDLGSFGQQKIRTPHLDRLAAEGMRLTGHYSGNAVCAPSRCVLLTGRHPGHAAIRDNRERQPEGQAPLPKGTVTLARLLQSVGYRTGAFGKWGLGSPGSEGDPLRQGFDRFFGYNCQRQAHNYYPTSLWDNARRVALRNPPFSPHQRLPSDADSRNPASYRAFSGSDYAPDRIHRQAQEFIREQRSNTFFLFVPTTVPHLALQVPEDSLAEYQDRFPEEPYRGTNSYLPHRQPRAAYAAMITRLDREVGRLVALVDELGLAEQTIFIFTSDNGPLYDQLGGTDTDFFRSAGDLRGRKGSLHEGGIRVPLIVRWKSRIAPGTHSDRVTGFEDWLPTLLDLAGHPETIPPGIDGISFAPTLHGRPQEPRPFLYREFPSYGGQQMVRVGDWKAVRHGLTPRPPSRNRPNDAPAHAARIRTELYDLKHDSGEVTDVAARHPGIVVQLERRMVMEHDRSVEFPIPLLDGAQPRP